MWSPKCRLLEHRVASRYSFSILPFPVAVLRKVLRFIEGLVLMLLLIVWLTLVVVGHWLIIVCTRFISLLEWLAQLGNAAGMEEWHTDSEAARFLLGRLRNDHA